MARSKHPKPTYEAHIASRRARGLDRMLAAMGLANGYWLHVYDADDICLSSDEECYPTEAEAEQAVQTARSRHPGAARIDIELSRHGEDGQRRSEDVSAWEWSDAEQQFVRFL